MTARHCYDCAQVTSGDCGKHGPDTNYNQAIQRGDARFLILTSEQAAYISDVVNADLERAASLGADNTVALGESVLEQLEKK